MGIRERTQENIEVILKEIENGAESTKDISKKTGISLPKLYYYSQLGLVKYPRKREIRRNPKIDRMVELGMPVKKIVETTGLTRQAVHLYLHKTNQHEGYGMKKNYEALEKLCGIE